MIRVYLYDYFLREQIPSNGLVDHMFEVMRPWLAENTEGYSFDGVTRYSLRYEFEHEADALAFKLRFGI